MCSSIILDHYKAITILRRSSTGNYPMFSRPKKKRRKKKQAGRQLRWVQPAFLPHDLIQLGSLKKAKRKKEETQKKLCRRLSVGWVTCRTVAYHYSTGCNLLSLEDIELIMPACPISPGYYPSMQLLFHQIYIYTDRYIIVVMWLRSPQTNFLLVKATLIAKDILFL